jgi:hypothetical protein
MGLIWPPTQRRPLIYIKRPGPRVCRGRDHASAQMFCQLYGKARDTPLTGSGLSSPPSVLIVSSIAQIAVNPASASTAASTCDGQPPIWRPTSAAWAGRGDTVLVAGEDLRATEVAAIGHGLEHLALEALLASCADLSRCSSSRASMVLGIDGDLHVVADDAGAAAAPSSDCRDRSERFADRATQAQAFPSPPSALSASR